MNKTLKSNIFLIAAAIIWGSAFVAQRTGMDHIGPFYFCALRSFLGSGALAIVALITDRRNRAALQSRTPEKKALDKKNLLTGGLVCGIVLFFGMNLQQMGLVSVDAGKTGFITALYIVIVPVLGVFFKRKMTLFTWLGVILGVIGLYLLCITSEFTIMPGDLLVLIGALFWATHILCIDHFAPRVNPVKLTAMQFLVAGILSLIVSLFTETITVGAVREGWFSILYTGIFSSAIAFTFQGIGQRDANPTTASIIMSSEALFAALTGFIFLGETFTMREGLGCIFMFSAVIISQLPSPNFKKNRD
jgi:drug/metabolite transporter (DMT)-like permease